MKGDETRLYTDSLGFTELYYRRVVDAIYFASRIDPLLALCDEKLSTDWRAWADIVGLGYPLGDRTPFLEIRRMTPGMAWRSLPGADLRRETDTPSWMTLDSKKEVSPAGMASLVAHRIPRTPLRRPAVLLSGGWDSRMLAGLACSRSLRRPHAWTTSPDDGFDEDVTLAGPVAKSFGMKHHLEIPDEGGFRDHATAVRRRVQFQTWMHTWLNPLARRLDKVRAPIIDGLAGDVLLKSLFVSGEMASIEDRAARMRRVWASLSAGAGLGNDAIIPPELRSFVTEISCANFSGVSDLIPDESHDATIAVLLTRTMRGIAPSPVWIFGPENDVRLPFLDPAVLSAALTVPIDRKADGEYYRQVLQEVAPRAATLPSTNDGRPKPERGPQRLTNPASLEWMANLIAGSDDALGMLTDRTRKAVLEEPDELTRISSFSTQVRLLQIASMLAEWQKEYGALLNDLGTAPWQRNGPPRS